MDKKKELKKGGNAHNFMDKFLTKLKMTKHGGEEKQGGMGSGKKLKESESSSSTSGEGKNFITWDKSKVTPENIMEFSEQLHQLVEYLQSLKDVMYCTYEYPNEVDDEPLPDFVSRNHPNCSQCLISAKGHILGRAINLFFGAKIIHLCKLSEQLEKEALDLRSLFRDVRAAAIDIERLKKQRCLVKKEKCIATKKLDKLREEEIKELESIICAYSKPLHAKWESIKNTSKADVLENFMNEVTARHRAIEILQELVRRKLSKISKKTTTPFILKKIISSTNMNNKIKNQDKSTSNWNINPFPDIEKFSQTIDKVVRNTPDRDVLRVNRRKRQKELREERRRQNLENATTTATTATSNSNAENTGLDLQLVPIDNFPTEEVEEVALPKPPTNTNLSTRTPPIINIEFTSDDDSVSMSSSDFTIENFVQTGNNDVQADLQTEMRSVLQALFGEIRQIPQIGGFSVRNRHNNSGNDLRSPRTASH